MGGGPDELPDTYEEVQPITMKSIQIQFYCLDVDQIVQSLRLYGGEGRFVGELRTFDWIHPGTDAFSRILVLKEL